MHYYRDKTGSAIAEGNLSVTKGNHSKMPPKGTEYKLGDERGHNNASSLGSSKDFDGNKAQVNVFAQSKDLNHGSWYAVEDSERTVLKNKAKIHSKKTAYMSNDNKRPDAFMVSDTVTYADGTSEKVHFSFQNCSNAEHATYQNTLESKCDIDSSAASGGELRKNMSKNEYGTLMKKTDEEIPSIKEEYCRVSLNRRR